MLNLNLDRLETILFLGAHCDDIEIGCGGALLELGRSLRNSRICWIVFSSNEVRRQEAEASAAKFLPEGCDLDLRILDYRNGYFPSCRDAIKDYFETLKQELSPDLIFCHAGHDLHQDHQTLNALCWNTFRSHLILEYEIPKYDGDLGNPNVFVPLSPVICRDKARLIVESFESQKDKAWFTADTFESLARLRGIQCASATGYAEGFYAKKLTIGIGGRQA